MFEVKLMLSNFLIKTSYFFASKFKFWSSSDTEGTYLCVMQKHGV